MHTSIFVLIPKNIESTEYEADPGNLAWLIACFDAVDSTQQPEEDRAKKFSCHSNGNKTFWYLTMTH